MTLINADLKQIEVVVFAHLCKDPTLTQLLLDGKDIHKFIASNVYDKKEEEVTSEERTDAKTSTFGIIYGNGARTLSERTGRSFEWCQNFIETFYGLFPKAKEWHTEIIRIVQETGELKLFTGERLKFTKYPAKYDWQIRKGITETYNPPDIKNHPVQHLAFIIMSIILGNFFREKALYKKDKYLLINTVHDSLMIDCKLEYTEECIKDIVDTVEKVDDTVYSLWREKIKIPIKIDISIGERWSDL